MEANSMNPDQTAAVWSSSLILVHSVAYLWSDFDLIKENFNQYLSKADSSKSSY